MPPRQSGAATKWGRSRQRRVRVRASGGRPLVQNSPGRNRRGWTTMLRYSVCCTAPLTAQQWAKRHIGRGAKIDNLVQVGHACTGRRRYVALRPGRARGHNPHRQPLHPCRASGHSRTSYDWRWRHANGPEWSADRRARRCNLFRVSGDGKSGVAKVGGSFQQAARLTKGSACSAGGSGASQRNNRMSKGRAATESRWRPTFARGLAALCADWLPAPRSAGRPSQSFRL